MPKGGGSKGWFKHNLVAKNELMNDYGFAGEIDEVEFVFSETGKQTINDRIAKRIQSEFRVSWRKIHEVRMRTGTKERPGFCSDISMTGAKLRVREKLEMRDEVRMTLLVRKDYLPADYPVLTLEAHVIWCDRAKTKNPKPRFDAGITFKELNMEDKERLTMIVLGKLDDIIPGPSEVEDVPPPIPGVDSSRSVASEPMAEKQNAPQPDVLEDFEL